MDIKRLIVTGSILLTVWGCDPEGSSQYYVVNQLDQEAQLLVSKAEEDQRYTLAPEAPVLIKTEQGIAGDDFNVFDIDSLQVVYQDDTLFWTINNISSATDKNFYDVNDWQKEVVDDDEAVYRFVLETD